MTAATEETTAPTEAQAPGTYADITIQDYGTIEPDRQPVITSVVIRTVESAAEETEAA